MQSIEVAVVGFVIVFFIAITFYIAGALSAGSQQSGQAELNVLAQQILQRITSYSAYNLSRDIGVASPTTPGYLSDYAIDYLALASAQLSGYPACNVWNTQSTLAQYVGNTVYMAGYGYVIPTAIYATLNLTAIAKNFFGNNYNRYDVEIQIKPLVRLAICPYVVFASGLTFNNPSPICQQFYATYSNLQNKTIYIVARGVGSYPQGQVVYNLYYCTTSTCYPPYTGTAALSPLFSSGGYYYSYAAVSTPSFISYSQIAQLNAALVAYVQKVTYPYSAAFYVFNATSVSLIYGAPFPGSTSTTLYLIHDADYIYPNSNVPCDRAPTTQGRQSLGVRYLSLYTGQGFMTYASGITLDPGTGNSNVKVLDCSLCTPSAQCTACWVNLPTDALLAIVYVTPSSSSGNIPGAALVPIPLFPAPPATDVDIKTWLRWGFANTPQTYAASAWGIFNSLTTTYLVNVTVYEYPSPMR